MADFQRSEGEFEALGIKVVAASVDPLESAQETVQRHGITFKVGYGLDAAEVSGLVGGFYNDAEGYLHATGFVLAPDGKIVNAVYSTSSVGRLVAADCLALVKYLTEKG